jgi:hypothetical protein
MAQVVFTGFVMFVQLCVTLGWAPSWLSIRTRPIRLIDPAAIGAVVIQAWLGPVCPLTRFELYLRGGEAD